MPALRYVRAANRFRGPHSMRDPACGSIGQRGRDSRRRNGRGIPYALHPPFSDFFLKNKKFCDAQIEISPASVGFHGFI